MKSILLYSVIGAVVSIMMFLVISAGIDMQEIFYFILLGLPGVVGCAYGLFQALKEDAQRAREDKQDE